MPSSGSSTVTPTNAAPYQPEPPRIPNAIEAKLFSEYTALFGPREAEEYLEALDRNDIRYPRATRTREEYADDACVHRLQTFAATRADSQKLGIWIGGALAGQCWNNMRRQALVTLVLVRAFKAIAERDKKPGILDGERQREKEEVFWRMLEGQWNWELWFQGWGRETHAVGVMGDFKDFDKVMRQRKK